VKTVKYFLALISAVFINISVINITLLSKRAQIIAKVICKIHCQKQYIYIFIVMYTNIELYLTFHNGRIILVVILLYFYALKINV